MCNNINIDISCILVCVKYRILQEMFTAKFSIICVYLRCQEA